MHHFKPQNMENIYNIAEARVLYNFPIVVNSDCNFVHRLELLRINPYNTRIHSVQPIQACITMQAFNSLLSANFVSFEYLLS